MNYKRRKDKNLSTADMDQVRKLFIMPDSPDKFIEFGNELLGLIHSFFQEKGGIHSAISLPDLGKLFSDIDLPREPQMLDEVLGEIKKKVINHSVKVGNPYYIGHMTSAIPYFMILLEMIIAALNQNQVKIESAKASTYVEREVISWVHRMVFGKSKSYYTKNIQNREVSLGNVTTDGTMANLAAMAVARNKAFAPNGDFPGVRKAGLAAAMKHYGYDRAVILVSERGHYSIDKVARLLGLGQDNVLRIRVDEDDKIDINELKRVSSELQNDTRVRTRIIAMVGIAGTTETGNIDHLHEIARIAKKYHAHFHVDAAWGGGLMVVESYRYLFSGIEKADSVTVDAHKLLYNPVSMGMVLFRSRKDLENLKHCSEYIIRQDSVDLGRFTIEGSRTFAALKPWATFKIMGIRGFELLFDHAFQLTSSMRGLVEVHKNFEAMNRPELFIFTYRFVPERVQQKLTQLMIQARGKGAKDVRSAQSRIRSINETLNNLNIELHKDLRDEDESFVSRTSYRSPRYYYQKVVILRSVLVNPLTDVDILKEIIDSQNSLGEKIYRSHFAHVFERI